MERANEELTFVVPAAQTLLVAGEEAT